MDCIGMFPYKDMASRSRKATESPNFIEIKLNKIRRQRDTFKIKENEKKNLKKF